MNLEAQAFWRDWIDGDHDVPGLRLRTIPLLEHMRTASQDEDWDQLERLLQTYSYVADLCQDEPLLTTYESGLMYINMDLADSMWVLGDLQRAVEHLNWIRSTLEAGDRRRQQAGMVERPQSEIRYKCIGIRAACLLEDASLFEAGLPELETTVMTAELWRLVDVVLQYLQENRSHDEDYISFMQHDLARWELEICKLSERHNPSFSEVAISRFNARMGSHLEQAIRSFAEMDGSESRSSWYWDYELSKLETSGVFSRAEVLLCAEQRNTSARLSFGKGARQLSHPWRRQVERMLSVAAD